MGITHRENVCIELNSLKTRIQIAMSPPPIKTLESRRALARDLFDLTGGRRLIVLSDENGIALIPDVLFEENMNKAMQSAFERS